MHRLSGGIRHTLGPTLQYSVTVRILGFDRMGRAGCYEVAVAIQQPTLEVVYHEGGSIGRGHTNPDTGHGGKSQDGRDR